LQKKDAGLPGKNRDDPLALASQQAPQDRDV
jgi:hypothetical protein